MRNKTIPAYHSPVGVRAEGRSPLAPGEGAQGREHPGGRLVGTAAVEILLATVHQQCTPTIQPLLPQVLSTAR